MTSRKRRRSDSSDSSDQILPSGDKKLRTDLWNFSDYLASKVWCSPFSSIGSSHTLYMCIHRNGLHRRPKYVKSYTNS